MKAVYDSGRGVVCHCSARARGTRIVIPTKLQPRTLALAHGGPLGLVGTKQNLRTKVW